MNKKGSVQFIAGLTAKRAFVLLLTLALILPGGVPGARARVDILYVKEAPADDANCSSWVDACSLQYALAHALSGEQIWVAKGVYTPATNPEDRAATFQLIDGLAIYGGFAGTESSLGERDWIANGTILSGDLNRNDGQDFANNGENSYHVVTGASGATLDGVTIRGGNANGISTDFSGGGLYNTSGSLTLTNVIFSDNSAEYGGGISNEVGVLTLRSSNFSGNTAIHGGGIYNNSGAVNVSSSSFSGNESYEYYSEGGGIYNDRGTVNVSSSTFSGNRAIGFIARGASIFNGNGTFNVSISTFSGNYATASGGGIYNYSGTVNVISSTFSGNSAPSGVAIYNNIGMVNLGNTIVASSQGKNCAGNITDKGGNLTFGDAPCPGIVGDPRLGPLQDNGGPTLTHALLPGSPAIDAGEAGNCFAPDNLDQRGVTRPVDGDEDGDPICDIGSYEYQPTHLLYLPLVQRH